MIAVSPVFLALRSHPLRPWAPGASQAQLFNTYVFETVFATILQSSCHNTSLSLPRDPRAAHATKSEEVIGTSYPRPSRIGVAVACDSCRRRKIRCDGQRPSCANCKQKGGECVYRDEAELSRESQSLVLEIIRLLNGLPEVEVLRRIQSLRKEINAATILSVLRDQDLQERDVDDFSVTAETMSDQFQSLELGPQNPNAYPALPNITPDLLRDDVYQRLVQPTTSNSASGATDERHGSGSSSRSLCDRRLADLEISHWTSVAVSNEQAAHAISLYLETDHPLLGFFDPNLFISDLVMVKTDYCSSMVVNALLYWACQMNSMQDPECGPLAIHFCTEAESLWQRQRESDSILNLAALLFLSIGYLGQGRNHSVLSYLVEASSLAFRLDLFTDTELQDQSSFSHMSAKEKSARSYAAWGAFNWLTHMSLFYRQPGLQCPKRRPKLPIPGSFGSVQVNGPSHDSDDEPLDPEAPYMGGAMPHICLFWCILHELAMLYKHKGSLGDDRRALYFAEYKFRELLAWSNRLPPRFSRNDQSPHYVQILHIWFHVAVLDLFRFSMSGRLRSQQLRTFTHPVSSPETVCVASAHQLKHLILNYRLNFSSASYTVLWHSALTYLANTILHYPKDDTWFFYFLLCIYGYERLRPCWRVSQAVSTALLSMALQKGDISSSTARQLLGDIGDNSGHDMPGEIRATFMADLDLATHDPHSASVEKVADDFDRNAILQEYTNVFDEKKTD